MSVALKKTRVDATLLTVTDARRRAVFLSTCVPFFVGSPPAGRLHHGRYGTERQFWLACMHHCWTGCGPL